MNQTENGMQKKKIVNKIAETKKNDDFPLVFARKSLLLWRKSKKEDHAHWSRQGKKGFIECSH